ncbi:PAS domain-containing protein [Splendidivirga corallicola]
MNREVPAYLKRRIQPTNLIAFLLTFVVAIPFTIISYLYLPLITAFIPGFGAAICSTVLVLNHFGWVYYSRLIIAVLPILLGASYNVLLCGPQDEPITGVFLCELSFTFIPLVIMDFRERKFLFFTLLISAAAIVSFPFTRDWHTLDADLTILRNSWFSAISYIIPVIVSFGCMYGILSINLKAEKQLEKFFSLNRDLFVIGNFKGYFTKLNPAWEKVLGYTTHELTQERFIKFVHPDDREAAVQRAPVLLRGSDVSNFTVRYLHKDGSSRNIQWNLIPDVEEGLVYASGRDITEQIKAEENIRIRERALSAIGTGVVITDYNLPDNPVIYCNPANQVITGYSPEEIIGKNLRFLQNEDRNQKALDKLREAIKEKKDCKVLLRNYKKDGTFFWNELTISPVFDSKGNTTHFVGLQNDITKQVTAQEELKSSREQLKQNTQRLNIALHSGGIGIWEWEINSNKVFWYGIMDKIFDFDPKDFDNSFNSFIDKIDEGDVEEVFAAIDKAVNETGQFESEYRVVWNDQSVHHILSRGSVVTDKDGKPFKMFGTCIDTTQKVIMEEKIKKTNEELKDFAHIVSHDLKAPLRAINSLAQWIVQDYKDRLDENGQKQFELLIGRVKKMEQLIDGILQYSRAGQSNEERESVNLDELLLDVIDLISPPEHIKVEIKGSLPRISAERTRLQQVFQNLISNAIKYNDKEEGRVWISCENVNNFWQFGISDNGPGIEESHFDKIFQIFQTLQSQSTYESTGIGLTIVKKTVELYGGKIWLESEIGKGTTFYFTIPIQNQEEEVCI